MAERTSLKQIRDAGKRKKAGTDIGVIGALADPQFREDVLRGLGETSARGVAGVLGAPVDLTTMALRPFGYSVPAEQVVGGSDYIGRQMERAGLISGERRPIAEMLGGIMTPDPLDVAKLGAMAVPAIGKALDPAELKRLRNEAIGAKDEFDRYYSAVKRREVEPTAEDYFGRSTEMADAQERLAAKMSEIPDEAFGFQSRTSDGRLTMITPSSKKAGHYQVTYFDKKGEPFGDTLYPSREQALNEFLKESDLRTVQGTGQYLPQYHTAAPRDEAMRIAQANAAKPTSEGGLGLRPDNTAMERAQAMGFEPNMYHATGADFNEIDLSKAGTASGGNVRAFFTAKGTGLSEDYLPKELVPKKEYANVYRNKDRYQKALASKYSEFAQQPDLFTAKPEIKNPQQIESIMRGNKDLSQMFENYIGNPDFVQGYAKNRQMARRLSKDIESEFPKMHTEQYATGANVMPMMVNKNNLFEFDAGGQAWSPDLDKKIQSLLRESGLAGVVDGVNIRNIYDGKAGKISDTQMIFNPSAVRSSSAAFDPARRYESDLLGAADPRLLGIVGAGTAAGLYGYDQRQKEKEKRSAK